MSSLEESRSNNQGSPDGAQKVAASLDANASRIRRRNRMITSCLECRRRKLKCDRLHPCTNCSKGKRDCVFLAPSLDSATRLKLAELKERMGTLERSLEKEVSQPSQIAEGELHVGSKPSGSESPAPGPEDEFSLQPTRLALMDVTYEDEADDVMVDLGIQVGNMRVTDRLGGFQEEQHNSANRDIPGDDGNEVLRLLELANQGVQLPFLDPGPSFIAPRSDMLLGSSLQECTLLDMLPSKPVADRLMEQYWEACHPIARIVHRQSLEARYKLLWDNIALGIEPTPSIQAIIFATLFTAAVSMTADSVLDSFGVDQRSLIERFQLGTESALGKAHFLRSTKIETLQAFVMYLIPMCRETISRVHSALVGTAIRLAECMGLHRDPSEYNYGPVETHIRRLIWYQLCFLDLRTAEVQGPRVTIRSDEFSTKLPLNINDIDLIAGHEEESREWTDMTFACLRFESQELIREAFVDRIRLEQRKLTITGAIGKMESARRKMYEKYGPIFNRPNLTPIQHAASVTMSFMLHRLHIILLHKFYNSWQTTMPDRLVQLIINTGVQQLEDAITLETSTDLRPWIWYSRAYHNFHTAFLLLVDVTTHPLRREADRIWRCLDYVYEIKDDYQSQNLTRGQIIEHRRKKSHMIMCQFRDRMRVYRALRKIKTSVDIDEIVLTQSIDSSPIPSDTAAEEVDTMVSFKLEPHTLLPSQASQEKARALISQSSYSSQFQNVGSVLTPESQTKVQNYAPGQFPQVASGLGNFSGFDALQSSWLPTAPAMSAATASQATWKISPPSSEDLPMPEVDWTEWDKMFPPHLNDGNLDLPPQTLSATMQNEMDPNTASMFSYPSFNPGYFGNR
uniref:Putative transcriptional regulatory protein n=1 Tax=Talaromyces marneffei PM1 TaxID=1077442 RepID=A0A093VTI3_TALMA